MPSDLLSDRFECFPNSEVIATAGKFHGCPLWAVHYWGIAHDGGADSEESSGEYTFKLGPEDYAAWPSLAGVRAITLWQDPHGYVLYYASCGDSYEAGPAGRLPDGFEGSGAVVGGAEVSVDSITEADAAEANAQRATPVPEDTDSDRAGDSGLREIKRIGEAIISPQAPKDWPFVVFLHLGRAAFTAGDVAGAIGELGFSGQGVAA